MLALLCKCWLEGSGRWKRTLSLTENQIAEQTSLGILCDKVIEASWMALVVVAPLFFNVYSHRSFEPDKTALMRSIALVMTLAWVIKMLEVIKLAGAECHGQKGIKFEIKPRVGIHLLPFVQVKI